MSEKSYEEMSLEELQIENMRNLRLVSLYLNIPVKYSSNTHLTDEALKRYLEAKDIANTLRMMVADNIKIEDIAEKLTIFNVKFEVNHILDLMIKGNWIENIEDFSYIKKEAK